MRGITQEEFDSIKIGDTVTFEGQSNRSGTGKVVRLMWEKEDKKLVVDVSLYNFGWPLDEYPGRKFWQVRKAYVAIHKGDEAKINAAETASYYAAVTGDIP